MESEVCRVEFRIVWVTGLREIGGTVLPIILRDLFTVLPDDLFILRGIIFLTRFFLSLFPKILAVMPSLFNSDTKCLKIQMTYEPY